jgi:hypothetical protein
MRVQRSALPLLLSWLLVACASTIVGSAWFDTSYQGGPFKKIIVVGAGAPDQRVFEDAFARQLRSAGVESTPGYTLLSGEGEQSDAAFTAALDRSGADGVLIVQLLSVDTHTQIATTMAPGPPMSWGWGRAPTPSFGRTSVPMPQVSQQNIARVETRLYEIHSRQLIWAASTDTFNPTSVARETPGFAELVIRELRARGLIAGAK